MKLIKTTRILIFLGIFINSFFSPFYFLANDHDFSSWQESLKRHVKNGLVHYAAIQKNPNLFDGAVSAIGHIKREEYDPWSQNEKKAFWINAYNIGAIKLIVDYYPLKRSLGLQALRYPPNSIQQIPDVWNQKALTILGRKVSLNYMENGILRKEFQDPRIHFAIVCASLGCPVLRDEPYVPEQLDAQLDEAARHFMQDHKKVNYDARNNTLYLSPIFKWFKEDFEKVGGVISFVKKYKPEGMPLRDDAKIQWLDYDWSLNEQKLK